MRKPIPHAKRSSSLFRILLITGGLLGLLFVVQQSVRAILHEENRNETATLSSTPTPEPSPTALAIVDNEEPTPSLAALLETNSDITTAYYFRKLSESNALVRGTETPMTAASVSKLITGVYAYRQIEAGNISRSTKLGSYTVGWQLEQLLRQSNNVSWQLFFTLFDKNTVTSFGRDELGLTSYDSAENLLSTADAASLLERLYKRELLSEESTSEMLSYLQNTYNETYIPPALQPGDTIYHKVGEYEDAVNDAAIIERNGEAYILVLMTDGNGYPNFPRRTEYIRSLTRAFFAEAS